MNYNGTGSDQQESGSDAEYVSRLFPRHIEKLRSSVLSDATIRSNGYESTRDTMRVQQILNRKWVANDDYLLIPSLDQNGEPYSPPHYYVRPDNPGVDKSGKSYPKYMSPSKENEAAETHIRFGINARRILGDVTIPIALTEGALKTDCIDQNVMACLGINGVSMWSAPALKDPKTGKRISRRELHRELKSVAWKCRKVYIIFDSDRLTKLHVRREEMRLAKALKAEGATVLIVQIPPSLSGSKNGADDFIHTCGVDAFMKLLEGAKTIDQILAEDENTIIISTREHIVNDKACKSLRRDKRLYQRGGSLVRIIETKKEPASNTAIRRPMGSLRVKPLSSSLVRDRLTKFATFMQWAGSADNPELKPAHPPDWTVKAVTDRGEWPGVRQIDTIITHPILLPDGSLLTSSGFHKSMRLFASIPESLKIDVPESPSLGAVKSAVAVLLDVVSDFPFESDSHRSAWLASLLTPLAYHSFDGNTPMFLFDGNTRGVGKGLLADTVSLTVKGQRFSTMAYTPDREELRKKITSLAIEGENMVLLDNLSGNVGNDILDNALTTNRWKDRILGGNNTFDGPLNVCWYATGNNVQIHADTARRICHIRMETTDERPEVRTNVTHADLRGHVLANRSKLLSAALTILRGWVEAGRPRHGLQPWGSFEGWSSVVREAIVFAGQPDPGETRDGIQGKSDTDAMAMNAVIAGIQQLNGDGDGVTVSEITAAITRKPTDPPLPEWAAGLAEAVTELCGKRGKLGHRLRQFRRRTFADGLFLDNDDAKNRAKVARWFVSCRNEQSKNAGDEDVSNSSPAPSPAKNCEKMACKSSDAGHAGHAGDDSYAHTYAGTRAHAHAHAGPAGECPASPTSPAETETETWKAS